MKNTHILMVLGSLGSLILAVLPAFVLSNRPLISVRAMKAVDQRLDTYAKR